MKKYVIGFLILAPFISLSAYYYFNRTVTCVGDIYLLKIGDKTLDIKVADTDNLREQGLSNYKQLARTEAMLFVFDYDITPNFWMKEMLFPLHIFWIDKNYKIVDVSKNVIPESYPKTFSPKIPIRFVLETPITFDENPDKLIGKKVELICRSKFYN